MIYFQGSIIKKIFSHLLLMSHFSKNVTSSHDCQTPSWFKVQCRFSCDVMTRLKVKILCNTTILKSFTIAYCARWVNIQYSARTERQKEVTPSSTVRRLRGQAWWYCGECDNLALYSVGQVEFRTCWVLKSTLHTTNTVIKSMYI